MVQQETNYTQGYSKATVGSHASRTIHSDAAFLIPFIKPSDTILDVGCGPGTITVGFAKLVPEGSVIGIDISEVILAQARELAEAKAKEVRSDSTPNQSNISFQKADLLAGLPFDDDSFDVVFSSQLFPHLHPTATRQKALWEMRRVLKPGGILATRDAAELRFYPLDYDLDRLWGRNMARALRDGDPDARLPGGEMPASYRQVGFDAGAGKLVVGAGTTVHSSRELRKWYVDGCLGRLSRGNVFRDSWLRVGISEAEIEETRQAMVRWAQDDDAWYVALQAEILGWK